MWVFLIPLAAVGVGFAFLFGRAHDGGSALGGGSGGDMPEGAITGYSPAERQMALRRALVAGGPLPDAWLRFFEATAQRESSFKPRAWNKSASEREASRRLVYRTNAQGLQPNVARLKAIGQDPDAWVFGSKGLYQFLGPAVALAGVGLRFPESIIDPDMAFEPGIAVAAALDFAEGLMGWKQFDGTWASLAVGWGNPSKMGDPASQAKSAESIERWAEKAGWKRGWAFEQVPPLPSRDQKELAAFAKAASLAYYKGGAS